MQGRTSAVIFLTGVTGFLGGALLSSLLDSPFFDDEVVCLVRGESEENAEDRVRQSLARFSFTPSRELPRNLTILRGDLLSDDWHRAPELNDVTRVVHLAANTSFGNARGIRKVNVGGALSVAKAAAGWKRLERYVHTGTATICGGDPPHVVQEDFYPNENSSHLVPYTKSKAEAELLLAKRFNDLPIVVARPSIVVGDTRFGCKPSGSIFWVLRAIEALRFITWDPRNRVDVIPADWAASALAHLLFKPELKHKRYHISAGADSSIRWTELAAEYARLRGGPARNRYETGDISQLTRQRIVKALGSGNPRHMMYGLQLYYRFCSLDLVFDNQRLLAEGCPAPPRFTSYMRLCLESSPSTVYEQLRVNMEPSLAVA